jgi:glucose-1-phosphate cytidylyltransferase
MENLAADGQLAAWVHRGFWQPMDTLRDKQHLNACGKAVRRPGSVGKLMRRW